MSKLRIILVDSNPLLVNEWNRQLSSIRSHGKREFPLSLSIETHLGLLSTIPEVPERNRSAIVSPANSVGGMGGGFDEALCQLYYTDKENTNPTVESWIRGYLRHGYTPLGTAHVVEFYNFPDFTHSDAWTRLRANSIVVVPTMRVPRSIYDVGTSDTEEVRDSKMKNVVRFIFDCIWEALCAVSRHNEKLETGNGTSTGARTPVDSIKGKVDTLIIPGLGTGYGGLPFDIVAKGMIGALTVWGMDLVSMNRRCIDRGLMCLAFLDEDYTLFKNPDIVKSQNETFCENTSFNVLEQEVGEFYNTICLKP